MHAAAVQAVCVVQESGLVVSCAFDGSVVFWDPQLAVAHRQGEDHDAGYREVKRYEQPGEDFRSLVLAPGCVLAGCESGRIVALPLPDDQELRAASTGGGPMDEVQTPSESLDGDDRGQRMASLDNAVDQIQKAERVKREAGGSRDVETTKAA